ncbi:MAG: autotransporter outer membrane beta-barrel domain-containing protein [Helicobacteraceae bacterium]
MKNYLIFFAFTQILLCGDPASVTTINQDADITQKNKYNSTDIPENNGVTIESNDKNISVRVKNGGSLELKAGGKNAPFHIGDTKKFGNLIVEQGGEVSVEQDKIIIGGKADNKQKELKNVSVVVKNGGKLTSKRLYLIQQEGSQAANTAYFHLERGGTATVHDDFTMGGAENSLSVADIEGRLSANVITVGLIKNATAYLNIKNGADVNVSLLEVGSNGTSSAAGTSAYAIIDNSKLVAKEIRVAREAATAAVLTVKNNANVDANFTIGSGGSNGILNIQDSGTLLRADNIVFEDYGGNIYLKDGAVLELSKDINRSHYSSINNLSGVADGNLTINNATLKITGNTKTDLFDGFTSTKNSKSYTYTSNLIVKENAYFDLQADRNISNKARIMGQGWLIKTGAKDLGLYASTKDVGVKVMAKEGKVNIFDSSYSMRDGETYAVHIKDKTTSGSFYSNGEIDISKGRLELDTDLDELLPLKDGKWTVLTAKDKINGDFKKIALTGQRNDVLKFIKDGSSTEKSYILTLKIRQLNVDSRSVAGVNKPFFDALQMVLSNESRSTENYPLLNKFVSQLREEDPQEFNRQLQQLGPILFSANVVNTSSKLAKDAVLARDLSAARAPDSAGGVAYAKLISAYERVNEGSNGKSAYGGSYSGFVAGVDKALADSVAGFAFSYIHADLSAEDGLNHNFKTNVFQGLAYADLALGERASLNLIAGLGLAKNTGTRTVDFKPKRSYKNKSEYYSTLYTLGGGVSYNFGALAPYARLEYTGVSEGDYSENSKDLALRVGSEKLQALSLKGGFKTNRQITSTLRFRSDFSLGVEKLTKTAKKVSSKLKPDFNYKNPKSSTSGLVTMMTMGLSWMPAKLVEVYADYGLGAQLDPYNKVFSLGANYKF